MPFDVEALRLDGLLRVRPKAFADERGWFAETYRESDFGKLGLPPRFAQDNHSHSAPRGVLRGLHYQLPPMAQGKLVRCVRGEVLDVAVDIRRDSPTFGEHESLLLTAENRQMLWVPPGFAHGFLTLTPHAEVLYKCTGEYSPRHERCIRWDDAKLGIAWPIDAPLVSPKDAAAPGLDDADIPERWTS